MPEQANPQHTNEKESQATKLVQIGDSLELFHTPENDSFASIKINGHREIFSLQEKRFKDYLMRCYFEQYEEAPNQQAIQSAIGVPRGKAL